MTGSDAFGMPVETAGLNTVIADGTSLPITLTSLAYSESFDLNNHNKIMTGFPLHPMLQGETINHFQASTHIPNYAKVSSSNTVRDLQLGRDIIGDFTSGTSYPINSTVQDRLTEGMPFPAASLATLLASKYGHHENLEKFATVVSNDYSDTVNHSIGNSLDCGYGAVAIDSSTRWDFSKIVDPPELSGTVKGRIALQPFQLVENVTANGCISSENAQMSSYSPSGSSRYSNELSLSLATSQPSVVCRTSIHDQRSDISCSGISNHSLYEPHLGQDQTSCNLRDISSCSNSYKPGHLPQYLSGSRYLGVMQEILADFARFSNENLNLMSYPAIGTVNNANPFIHSSDAAAGCSSTLGFIDSFNGGNKSLNQIEPTLQCSDFERRRKKHLLTLLQEVDNQYNQWFDEIHTVISAFHAVTELDPQIHTRFALQMISLLYKDLRERISSRILEMGVCFSKVGATEDEKSFEMSFIQKQWALQQLRRKDQQLWRPQRGLPERSVSVLRAWMFQNFLHPYPKDAEKHLLAIKSGLTRSQVSNWFINARVRLWKPLIEEMYAEMNRRKNRCNEAGNESAFRSHATLRHGDFHRTDLMKVNSYTK